MDDLTVCAVDGEPLVFRQKKTEDLDAKYFDRLVHDRLEKVMKHDEAKELMIQVHCACGCVTAEDSLVTCNPRK